MLPKIDRNIVRPILWFLLAGLLVWTPMAWADTVVVSEPEAVKTLHLTSGKSSLIRTDDSLTRVSVADPAVADFILLSSKEIYITGKAAGTTNMTLWKRDKILSVYNLEVTYDLTALKRQIHELFPDETELKVIRMKDSITLSGRMSSASRLAQVDALAQAFVPKGKVNNLVQVGGGQQVMLEVRVAEITRQVGKELGINFNTVDETNPNNVVVSMLGGLSQLVTPDKANIGQLSSTFAHLVAPSVNALTRFSIGKVSVTGLVDAMQQDGLLKILAKPTLIAMSGKEASFLAGGQFPVPVPQGLGTVGIQYKKFGVYLNFTPVVLSDHRINIKVHPSVSELDFSTAIQFSGYVVPGLSTREADTTVELGDGQSFAIAGLLNENIRDSISKFPFLGDIPVLGALFRSRSFQKHESELVIIVTPRLVKPLDMTAMSLPTDYYVEPGDKEIFLMGTLQGKTARQPMLKGMDMDGQFGHCLPK